jgi:hypothetical protein
MDRERLIRALMADQPNAAFGTGSPDEEAQKKSGLAALLSGAYQGLGGLAKRAMGNSANAIGTGTYDAAAPMEAAMTAMTGGVAGVPMRAGEAVLGAGPVRKLPMDEASRLERAKAQGYNVDERVYHETNRDFKEFKPEYGSQVWFTTDKSTLGQNGAAGHGKLIEAYLNNKKLADWSLYDKYGTDELMRMGYDGARLGTDIVTFNPKGIRSVDAKFDPKKVKSGNILAGAAGVAALGSGYDFEK